MAALLPAAAAAQAPTATPRPQETATAPPTEPATAPPTAASGTAEPTPPTPDDPAAEPRAVFFDDTEVFLPVLRYLGSDNACEPVVALQNIGSEPAQAVALLWDEPERDYGPDGSCERDCGPRWVECTGLIKPGQTWNLVPDQVADGAKGGVVYSFSTKRLSDYGLDRVFGFDDVIADYMCAMLFFGVTGDCDDYRRFTKSWREAAIFGGIPLDVARGAPLAAQVGRTCDGVSGEAAARAASYNGVPASRLGAYDPVERGYGNAVPVVTGGAAASNSYVTVQNAGTECTTIELIVREHLDRQGDTGDETEPCPDAVSCGRVELGPGNSHTYDISSCVGGGGGMYSGNVTAMQPVVTVVDTVAEGTLSTYGAAPMGLELVTDPYDPFGAQISIGGTVAYGPLVYSGLGNGDGGGTYWASRIHISNHSSTTDAKVKLYMLDRSGDVITTLVEWVCPRGGVSWDLSEIDRIPGAWIGSVRVESQEWITPGGPAVQPPAISAVVESVLVDPTDAAAEPTIQEAYSYRMLTEREAFDWPIGQANGGLLSGTGLIAVPTLVKGIDGSAPSSEIVITNLVSKPGFTDFAVYVYDQNGLVDYLCAKLNEKQSEYINLRHWGFVGPGFRGSAVISAHYWEHDVYDRDGQNIVNLVGLGAVSALRAARPVSDTVSAALAVAPAQAQALAMAPAPAPAQAPDWARTGAGSVGVPIRPENPQAFGDRVPLCPGTRPPNEPPMPTRTPGRPPTAVPSATPDVVPGPPSAAAAGEVFVPELLYSVNADTCAPTVRVQNVGPEPSKAVALFWEDPTLTDGDGFSCVERCGPKWVLCSALIRPGGSWTFEDDVLRQGKMSAAVYSFNTRSLEDLGIDPPHQTDADEFADLMCETMFFHVIGDCGDYLRFKHAFERGTEFLGIPQNLARGSPIAVEVDRECEVAGGEQGETRASSYVGVAQVGTGRLHDASGAYEYGVPIVRAADRLMGTELHIQNAGADCATVDVQYRAQDDCGPARSCGTIEIPVGMSRSVDIAACAGEDGTGAGLVVSDQPLALVVDSIMDDALLSYAADPVAAMTMADSSGRRIIVGSRTAWAPLVYSNYMPAAPPQDAVWTSRIQVQNTGALESAKVKLFVVDRAGDVIMGVTEWICPRESYTFDLSRLDGLPEDWVGSVRVESQSWRSPGQPLVEPPALLAVAENVRARWPEVGDWLRPRVTEGYSYRLVGEPEAFDWPDGHGAGGLDSGVGLIAVPSLIKGQEETGSSTELSITNVVSKPGFTDFVVAIYDQNGLLDYVCEKLNEKQTEYVDLAQWGYINHGFSGSALISAAFWEHHAYAGDGQHLRNLVGLAAASAVRPHLDGSGGAAGRPEGDEDGPGDASSGNLAVPFGLGLGSAPAHFDILCPSHPSPNPSRTPTPPVRWAEDPAFFPAVARGFDLLATEPPTEMFVAESSDPDRQEAYSGQ